MVWDKVEGFGEGRAGGPDQTKTEGFDSLAHRSNPGPANRDEFDRQKISVCRFANSKSTGRVSV
jgi:hypothetical protein